MFCPNCGCWNPDDSKFCSACATSMQAPTGTAAPVDAVSSSNSFVERWRKMAVSPILLILAAAISLLAILNIGNAFDYISYGFEGLSYSFFAAMVYIAQGVRDLALLVVAAGMWLTFVDGSKKGSKTVDPMGINLTTIGILVQFVSAAVIALFTLISLGDLGSLGYMLSSGDGFAEFIGFILGLGLGVLYFGLLFGSANGAKNAVMKKACSIHRVGGAAIISYLFAAFMLIYYVIINGQTQFALLLQIGTMLLQGVALSQYKNEMTK